MVRVINISYRVYVPTIDFDLISAAIFFGQMIV